MILEAFLFTKNCSKVSQSFNLSLFSTLRIAHFEAPDAALVAVLDKYGITFQKCVTS